MEILDATAADAAEIIRLQRLAYLSEAAIYDDYSILPLTQTIEELAAEFGHKTFLKAVKNGRLIGSVNGCLQGDSCLIGRLMVHPEFQGWGVGARLMRAVEGRFAGARSWELFTGEMSLRNIRMYERMGYAIVGREPCRGSRFNIVIMRKSRDAVAAPP